MAAGFMSEEDHDLKGEPCAVCHQPIHVGQRFYQGRGWMVLGHAVCVEMNPDVWDAALLAYGGPEPRQWSER